MSHITKLKVSIGRRVVGTLARDADNQIYFEYDHDWLASGFDLSPKTLTFSDAPQTARDPLFGGLHGVFNDSLPDGWGLLLMDREFKKRFGWSPGEIGALDRLAYIGSRAMGAIEYEPVYEQEPFQEEVDLLQLATAAAAVLQGSAQDVLTELRIQGGSPGGARPKVTVARSKSNQTYLSGFQDLPPGYSHWIVKFRSENDANDMGCAEKAYAEMANAAGVFMPPSDIVTIGDKKKTERFFAVRRFDRFGSNGRRHVISLAGLLYANFRVPCLDYQTVLSATSQLTHDVAEVKRAFRLMVFNVLAHNKDDHAKNFAFIHTGKEWRLSPAFDLTYSTGMGGEHTTAILGHGNPGPDHMLKLGKLFHLEKAEQIIGEVRYAVALWPEIAKRWKVTSRYSSEIQNALTKIDERFLKIVKSEFKFMESDHLSVDEELTDYDDEIVK